MVMELAIQTMRNYADTIELARWAESRHLAAFAVADHYLAGVNSAFALDQLAVLAAVAEATDTVELATLVSPITFRHPAVMLKIAVTLDEISGGRFTLGVGAGWMEAEHERFGLPFPPQSQRFDLLTEGLAYMRSALDGSEDGFEGSHYRLAPGAPPQPQGSNVRIVVGGSGARRTPDLAGTYADELNLSPSATPMRERIARARQAAVAAGRDPDALLISTAFPVVVGADEAEVDLRIDAVAARRGTTPENIRTRWADAGIPMGTTDHYLTRLEEIQSNGVQRVYFQVAFDPIEDVQRTFDLLAPTGR